ncbi:MAG TPA: hypothetical protein PL169_28445, partial [Leptospiraceae bacterium]|nr:hypothetical protein [Leptospiraceae bacterium]
MKTKIIQLKFGKYVFSTASFLLTFFLISNISCGSEKKTFVPYALIGINAAKSNNSSSGTGADNASNGSGVGSTSTSTSASTGTAAISCSDGIKNGTETDIDCGGS